MNPTTAIRIAAAALLCSIVLPGAAVAARQPDPAAGREIYRKGESPSGGTITASIGGDAAPIPAALLPCLNCHGSDGRGKPEGGVEPSNVTWLELTKPYRSTTINGRRRPPYTETTLARAIAEGVDSANRPLNAVMPHYTLAPDDMADLIAYLKILGRDEVPGVTEDSINVATIVPRSADKIGKQMTTVLSEYFKDAGEIHGRRISLARVSLPADPDAARKELKTVLETKQPLAFVGGVINGIETPVADVVDDTEIPLVLPVAAESDTSPANRQRFYLFPGIEEQLTGLLAFGAERMDHPLKDIVVFAPAAGNRMAANVIERTRGARLSAFVDSTRKDARTRLLAEAKKADAVLFLDSSFALAGVAGSIAKTPPRAALLFVSDLLPRDFFEAAATLPNVMVALPTSPVDLTPEGLAEFRAFAGKHGIERGHLATQIAAYTAAKVFVFALKKAGRELTRESLRSSLEGLYQFQTGIAPPISFGRTRRIGSTRIDVATVDPAARTLKPLGHFEVEH